MECAQILARGSRKFNKNCSGQFILIETTDADEKLTDAAVKGGAERVLVLKQSQLLQANEEKLRANLAKILHQLTIKVNKENHDDFVRFMEGRKSCFTSIKSKNILKR